MRSTRACASFLCEQSQRTERIRRELSSGGTLSNAVYSQSMAVRELTMLNKTIYYEAMPIYYRTKVFVLGLVAPGGISYASLATANICTLFRYASYGIDIPALRLPEFGGLS